MVENEEANMPSKRTFTYLSRKGGIGRILDMSPIVASVIWSGLNATQLTHAITPGIAPYCYETRVSYSDMNAR